MKTARELEREADQTRHVSEWLGWKIFRVVERPREYYRFHVEGWNGFLGERICWDVPTVGDLESYDLSEAVWETQDRRPVSGPTVGELCDRGNTDQG